MSDSSRQAVIIGAGPAGLTAAFELSARTDVRPIVLEASDAIGGLSRTVVYKGNRIDIGGHRFFSKSDRVMSWWAEMLPVEKTGVGQIGIAYRGGRRSVAAGDGPDPAVEDRVMLVRRRKSRIFYLRRFFDYPLRLSLATLRNLGPRRVARIGLSYVRSRVAPIRREENLEQFLINRFGRELYRTFFKSYTEKVWGVSCRDISAEWGAQRIKGLNVGKAIRHALGRPFRRPADGKRVETSLVERFLYPKFGPGQMWETCAARVLGLGGEIRLNRRVVRILTAGRRVTGVVARDDATGREETIPADYVFSTMPVVDLVRGIDGVPEDVRRISEGLVYRDFITVGLLLRGLRLRDGSERRLSDNWIYIQEPDVKVGRLQIFNNWSPWMVADADKTWVGLEYFCSEGDELWSRSDEELRGLASREMAAMGMIDEADVVDATVIRMPKSYPAYYGTYDRFGEIRTWVDRFENLYLIGRNGMHRYNNQDHSMLTAMAAVDNIVAGRCGKSNVWGVNAEGDYHEEEGGCREGTEAAEVSRPVCDPVLAVAGREIREAEPSTCDGRSWNEVGQKLSWSRPRGDVDGEPIGRPGSIGS